MKEKRKLTKEQKGMIKVVLAANKYFEVSRNQSEKEMAVRLLLELKELRKINEIEI